MKANKIHPISIITLLVLLVFCSFPNKLSGLPQKTLAKSVEDDLSTTVAKGVDLSAHFIQLGGSSKSTSRMGGGDCTLVTFGNDIQVLIDAGGEENDYDSLLSQFKSIMGEDKELEYVFVTHADSDHIANFVGGVNRNLFDYFLNNDYSVDHYIDFDFCNVEGQCTVEEFSKEENQDYLSLLKREGTDENSYEKYRQKRNDFFNKMKMSNREVKYAQVSDLISSKNYSFSGDSTLYNGAPDSVITLTSKSGKTDATAKIKVLYNYYTDHCVSNRNSGLVNNEISICLYFCYGENSFLLTGDLEEYVSTGTWSRQYGESYLVALNNVLQRRKSDGSWNNNIDVFKAGHHGSPTSNSEYLIDAIRPNYVYATCVYGTKAYSSEDSNQFLCQSVLNNLFKYTDYIYPMSMSLYGKDENGTWNVDTQKGQIPFYGAVSFSSDGKNVTAEQDSVYGFSPYYSLKTANHFLDTELFPYGKIFGASKGDLPKRLECPRFSREAPAFFYEFALRKSDGKMTNAKNLRSNCTLFKYGSRETLLNCGTSDNVSNQMLIDNVRDFCPDKKLELCIISNGNKQNFDALVGERKNKSEGYQAEEGNEGIIDFLSVEMLIDNANRTKWNASNEEYSDYENGRNYLKENGCSLKSPIQDTADINNDISSLFPSEVAVKLLNNPIERNIKEEGQNSLIVKIEVGKTNFLNIGQIKTDSEKDVFEELYNKNSTELSKKIDLMELPNGGDENCFDPVFAGKVLRDDVPLISNAILRDPDGFKSSELAKKLQKVSGGTQKISGLYYVDKYYEGQSNSDFDLTQQFSSKFSNSSFGESDKFSYCVRLLSDATNEIGNRFIIAPIYANSQATNRSNSSMDSRIKEVCYSI